MSVRLESLNLLLIEDHFFMRSIWRSILMGLGISHVIEAVDAAEAFQILGDPSNDDIDIVVVDFHLGDLNGAEITQLLRTSPDSPNPFIPIIGCTADTTRSNIRDFINAGADEIVAKPISSTVIYQRLRQVVEMRRPFVRGGSFFGPDRRRRNDVNYRGPERRENSINLESI